MIDVNMLRPRLLKCLLYACKRSLSSESSEFKLNKVLLLQKLSRLEIEQFRQPDLNEKELEQSIKKRGIDYDAMVRHHMVNKDYQCKVHEAFNQLGVTTRAINRFNYTESNLEWCDAVFPVGGDGTFLLAASRISNNNKAVVGFNSDPCRSEGHLCLPVKYSKDPRLALEKLKYGKFKWVFRTRIRVTFSGESKHSIPIELHEQALRFKLTDLVGEERRKTIESDKNPHDAKRILPVLALNEVFVGEILSAKVSYFEMRVDGCPQSTRVKSSGLCVCTGTGSTSWNMSINRLTRQDVNQVLQLYNSETMHNGVAPQLTEDIVTAVTDKFNEKFKFSAEERRLGYTIRDLISVGVWPKPKGIIEPRGFAKTIEIKSRCSDAGLVIDGGISFPFNDGTVTMLETHESDTLRTVRLFD